MGTVSFLAILRLAGRLWSVGLGEFYRDWVKAAFLRGLRHYAPALTDDNFAWGRWGVRAQAVSRDGELLDDFRMETGDRIPNVLNAPSPAATESLSIEKEIVSRLIELADPA